MAKIKKEIFCNWCKTWDDKERWEKTLVEDRFLIHCPTCNALLKTENGFQIRYKRETESE